MSREFRQTSVTIAAGTAIAAAVTTSLNLPPRIVSMIEVVVPPGCNGEVGFQIANSNTAIIPFDRGEWIVTNAEIVRLPLDDYITSGSWQIIAYNTGQFSHKLQVRTFADLVQRAVPASLNFIPSESISSSQSIESTIASLTGFPS